MGSVEFTINQAGIDELMAVDGPVARFVHHVAEPVLEAMQQGVGHDTGQLAESLGIEMVKVGHGPTATIEARVGVLASRNARTAGDATNAELLQYEEHGTGSEPAKHVSSQALHAAHG